MLANIRLFYSGKLLFATLQMSWLWICMHANTCTLDNYIVSSLRIHCLWPCICTQYVLFNIPALRSFSPWFHFFTRSHRSKYSRLKRFFGFCVLLSNKQFITFWNDRWCALCQTCFAGLRILKQAHFSICHLLHQRLNLELALTISKTINIFDWWLKNFGRHGTKIAICKNLQH